MAEYDTIFALSSGAPPAAIAIIRISGPDAMAAVRELGGQLPEPRTPALRKLRDREGRLLDEALLIAFPGPGSATGEDLVELHCHGGRAVVDAVHRALGEIDGLRSALPGEFTRRAFANGRLDLAEAEGLADLLSAETELQRRAAIGMASGRFSKIVESWRDRLLGLSGALEAVLDFGDEDDVGELPRSFADGVARLADELGEWLGRPHAEKLKEGFRVVFAGPPNAGKSTLFNALLEDEAAIVSAEPGTTRDVIERPVAIDGVPFTLVDIAGLRDETGDAIEAIGIDRARQQVEIADVVLWLGSEGAGPCGAWEIAAQIDRHDVVAKSSPRHALSAVTGEGVDGLKADLIAFARSMLGPVSQGALNARQRSLIAEARDALGGCGQSSDLLIMAEYLRQARIAFDRLIGRATTEDMLDALFGRFCIGK